MYLIDTVVSHGEARNLAMMTVILAGMTVTQAALGFSCGLVYNTVANGLLYQMRLGFMRRVQRLELENIARLNTGDLMTRLMNDTAKIQSFLTNFSFNLILNILTILVLLAVCIAIQPRLALIGLSPVPLFVVILWWIFRVLQRRSRHLHEQNARVMGQSQRILNGLESIKAWVAPVRSLFCGLAVHSF